MQTMQTLAQTPTPTPATTASQASQAAQAHQPTEASAAHRAAPPARPPAFLRVRLGPQEYGIAADAIHEVRAFEPPGAMRAAQGAGDGTGPGAGPACLLGVLNLRGRIVPIVDLRRLLGCTAIVADAFTALVVVKHGSRWVGAVVDAAGEMAPGQPGLKEIDVQGLLADPALALGS
jgi:purine-binding chemotaxis protein CheW